MVPGALEVILGDVDLLCEAKGVERVLVARAWHVIRLCRGANCSHGHRMWCAHVLPGRYIIYCLIICSMRVC
jgi:hypothetical protein